MAVNGRPLIAEVLTGLRRGLRRADLLLWLAPVIIWLAVTHVGGHVIELALSVALAFSLGLLIASHPGPSLVFLIVWIGVQQPVLAYLYHLGLPLPIVRPLAGLRDILLLGLMLAGLRAFKSEGRRLDRIDKLALTYIGIVCAYAVIPQLASGAVVAQPWNVRFLALRADVCFILLFLSTRYAPISERARRRAFWASVGVGVLLAAVGVYESIAPASWNTFAIQTIGMPRYWIDTINARLVNPNEIIWHGLFGGQVITRAASLLFEPTSLAFFLQLPFALALVAGMSRRPPARAFVAAALLAVGTILTLTRAGMLGLVVIGLVALRGTPRRSSPGRMRIAFLLLAGIVLVMPIVSSSGAGQRLQGNEDQFGRGHEETIVEGFQRLADRPLGTGLGTAPGIGDRFSIPGKLTSHNSYLQVGNELGIETMIVFIVFFWLVLRTMGRTARGGSEDPSLTFAVYAAGLSLAVGGIFQHVWTVVPVAWSWWALAGLAIRPGVVTDARTPSQQRARRI